MTAVSSLSTSVRLEGGDNNTAYQPDVVFHADDAWKNAPIQYEPLVLNPADYDLHDKEPRVFSQPLSMLRHGVAYVRVYNTKNRPQIRMLSELQNASARENITVTLSDAEFDFSADYKFQGGVGRFAQPSAERVLYHGKFTEHFRESLQFNGDTEKRIKYAAQNPDIAIADWTGFFNGQGESINRRDYPRNAPPNTTRSPSEYARYAHPTAAGFWSPTYRGNVFFAPYPVWGVVAIEYKVDYYLFSILYDVKSPARLFEVLRGESVDTGVLMRNASGDTVADETEVLQKTFKKIVFKGWRRDALFGQCDFFVFDQGRGVYAKYNIPEPDFNDFAQDEMPRKRIYKEVKRYRQYPDGASSGSNYIDVDQIEKISFVDIYGRVSHENVKDQSAAGTTA